MTSRAGRMMTWTMIFPSEMDLVNVPEKHVRWLAIYRINGQLTSSMFESKPPLTNSDISLRRIEFEEGQFDE